MAASSTTMQKKSMMTEKVKATTPDSMSELHSGKSKHEPLIPSDTPESKPKSDENINKEESTKTKAMVKSDLSHQAEFLRSIMADRKAQDAARSPALKAARMEAKEQQAVKARPRTREAVEAARQKMMARISERMEKTSEIAAHEDWLDSIMMTRDEANSERARHQSSTCKPDDSEKEIDDTTHQVIAPRSRLLAESVYRERHSKVASSPADFVRNNKKEGEHATNTNKREHELNQIAKWADRQKALSQYVKRAKQAEQAAASKERVREDSVKYTTACTQTESHDSRETFGTKNVHVSHVGSQVVLGHASKDEEIKALKQKLAELENANQARRTKHREEVGDADEVKEIASEAEDNADEASGHTDGDTGFKPRTTRKDGE